MSSEKRLWIIEARDGAWGANGICKGELVRCKECKYHQDELALADHADILRAYYYEKKPMPVIATEKHISTATAWRYERIGVASICAI